VIGFPHPTPQRKLANTYCIATEISKKKKKKTKSEAKIVDESTIEPMQVDVPICARFFERSFGFVELILAEAPASEEPEHKKKRKKREDVFEDITSKKKKKRRQASEPPTALVQSTSSTSAPDPTAEPSNSEIEEYLQSNSISLTAAKGAPSIKPVLSFEKLQIPLELKAALSGFQHPTPIQACSWPPALRGQDVVGIAETGRYDGATVVIIPL
jgi:hypothetical protein